MERRNARRAAGLPLTLAVTRRPPTAENQSVSSGLVRFVIRRTAFAAVLVLVVSSASLLLARYAPPEDAFGTQRAVLLEERHRLGFDAPLLQQYTH